MCVWGGGGVGSSKPGQIPQRQEIIAKGVHGSARKNQRSAVSPVTRVGRVILEQVLTHRPTNSGRKADGHALQNFNSRPNSDFKIPNFSPSSPQRNPSIQRDRWTDDTETKIPTPAPGTSTFYLRQHVRAFGSFYLFFFYFIFFYLAFS